MRRLPGLLVLLALVVSPPVPAGNNDQAVIGLHVTPVVQKGVCEAVDGAITSGTQTDTAPSATCTGEDFLVYSLVCNGSTRMEGQVPEGTGVAGIEYGLSYDATLSVTSIQVCADLNFPQPGWPASGTGTIATWDPVGNCQAEPSEPFVPNTVVAVAEAFLVTAHGPGHIHVTPRPVTGRAKVADCNSAEDDITGRIPSQLGIAGFCTWGFGACWPGTPVESTTWGRLKRAYGEP